MHHHNDQLNLWCLTVTQIVLQCRTDYLLPAGWGLKGQAGKRGRAALAPSNIFCLFRNFCSDWSYDFTETMIVLKLWLYWSSDCTEAMTVLKLWLYWSYDCTEALTVLKLWLYWSYDCTEALTVLKLWLYWSFDCTEAMTVLKLWLYSSYDCTEAMTVLPTYKCFFKEVKHYLVILWRA
jgi:hypothetical protein